MSISLDPVTMQTIASLGRLAGTMPPPGQPVPTSLEALQAQQQDLINQMAQQSATAAQGATEAGQAYQQAAQAPAPQLDPFSQLLTTLGGNVESTLTQDPGYRQRAQQRLIQAKSEIDKQREDNLTALKDLYKQRADVAEHLGDLATAEKYRQNHEKLALKLQEIHDQTSHQNAMEEIRARAAARPAGGGGAGSLAPDDINKIVDGIERGDLPAKGQGYYRNWGKIAAELQRRREARGGTGFNYNVSNKDQIATERFLLSVNSPPQLRVRQAIDNVGGTLTKLESLNQEITRTIPRTLWPQINRATLAAARNGLGPLAGAMNAQKAQSLATRLDGLISDLNFEMGYVFMGGNTPTDQGLKKAAKNLSANWDPQTLTDNIQQARDLLQVRRASVWNAGPIMESNRGGGGNNEPDNLTDDQAYEEYKKILAQQAAAAAGKKP